MSNIITIKLRLRESIANEIRDFQRKFSNVVRYSFNRFMEGHSRTDVFNLIRTINNVDELDLTWKREAAKVAESIALSAAKRDDKTVIFGGKGLFYKRLKGRLSREEYLRQRKLSYISCEGSKADTRGNRKFKFNADTLEGSVRLNGKTVSFSCHGQSRRNMDLVRQAALLAENGEIGITYRLNAEFFYICVDLDKLSFDGYTKDKDVTLALDMNPNYIGLSIVGKDGGVLLRQVYDLSKVDSNNKRRHELTEIAKSISKLCVHYRVGLVGYEKLLMPSSDKGKGRRFNKQVNNEWCRERFVASLHKWLGLVGCRWQEVIASYSSFIGCVMHPHETDSVAASLELNRRLREYAKQYIYKTEPKGDIVYPPFGMRHFNRWKESLGAESLGSWVDAYRWFKETRHSYRLTYPNWLMADGVRALRYKSFGSMVSHVML